MPSPTSSVPRRSTRATSMRSAPSPTQLMTSRSVDIRHRYHGALTTWADPAGSGSCGQRLLVALPAERAHDVSIVDRFCSGGGPADVAVALPSGDQMDVQVRDPLPAGRAVVLPDREPIW